ncbi:MAG: tryptophan synthase subunit alpha [bacterium]|nr:tryptophan synthase subunit alpha [bacterium]
MSRIAQRFKELKERNEAALLPFITTGYPDLQQRLRIVLALAEAVADIIELGIPYSDPVADGPVIQKASQQARAAGMDLKAFFSLVAEVRRKTGVPLVAMTYYNPVFVCGQKRFADNCRQSGIDGVILSDLPPEEGEEWLKIAAGAGLDTILLAAPTSTEERLRKAIDSTSGFIYCVSRLGVTGADQDLSGSLRPRLERMRAMTDKPLCVGFGLSMPEHIRQVAALADGAVIGSALVRLIADNAAAPDLLDKVRGFTALLKQATIR